MAQNAEDREVEELIEQLSSSPQKSPMQTPQEISDSSKPRQRSPVKELHGLLSKPGNKSRPYKGRLVKDRRSRTGVRGGPKKGGAGGKGTWGKLTDAYGGDDAVVTKDEHDPNYNSEEDNYVVKTVQPEMTEEQFQNFFEVLIKEYFDHGDAEEVAISLSELNLGSLESKIPQIAVTMALERKADQRELTSRLISDLYGEIISAPSMGKGFHKLLENLEDLCLDTPDAAEVLGCFIARAIADDCLPPAYVSNHNSGSDKTKIALSRAKVLLKMKHGMVRLDAVWGCGGGRRPVKVLINKMNLLLQEYLSSDDVQEAERCLLDLEVPHFHHELVFEAVVMALEDGSDRCSERMVKLLKYLSDSNILNPDQMKNGYLRVFDTMADISIDVPNAHVVLEKFVSRCFDAGFMSRAVKEKVSARGRKRFVSEGDSLSGPKEPVLKIGSVS